MEESYYKYMVEIVGKDKTKSVRTLHRCMYDVVGRICQVPFLRKDVTIKISRIDNDNEVK